MDAVNIYNEWISDSMYIRASDESMDREEDFSVGLKNRLHYQDRYWLIRVSDSFTLTFTSDSYPFFSSGNTFRPLNTQLELQKRIKITRVVRDRMGYDSWFEGGTSLVPGGTSERFVHGLIAPAVTKTISVNR